MLIRLKIYMKIIYHRNYITRQKDMFVICNTKFERNKNEYTIFVASSTDMIWLFLYFI